MTQSSSKSQKSAERAERLAAQLRGNLQKRKAQMRARRHSVETEQTELPTDLSKDREIPHKSDEN